MKTCDICGKKLGLTAVKYKLSDGNTVCWDCAGGNRSYLIMKKLTLADIKEEIREREEVANFIPTRIIDNILAIDEQNYMFTRKNYSDNNPLETLQQSGSFGKKQDKIHDLRLIRNYELLDNGAILTSGGFGTAAVGALTFGGFGAVTGAMLGKKAKMTSQLQIKIFMDDIENPVIYVNVSDKPIMKNSSRYKKELETAHKIISTLDILFSRINTQNSDNLIGQEGNDSVDEIRKYKALLDEGIITKEEFDLKKKQILQV